MPKKIDPELRARAVRMVLEHQQEYPSQTAAAGAVARLSMPHPKGRLTIVERSG